MFNNEQYNNEHKYYMELALEEAKKAYNKLEVPIGAIIVKEGKVIARAHNLRETNKSPLAHAEILAIDEATRKLGGWRLTGTTIYVTLEPCPMCAGAIYQSRVSKLVYGAADPKAGAVKSLYQILEDTRLNHQVEVIEGIMKEETAEILKSFFQELRVRNKKKYL
jgi:tRNA(adenine34) deaminase